MVRHGRKALGRRRLLLGGATAGLGALAASASGASAQTPQAPAGIEFLDYDPPRGWAAAARVGDIVYLAGETPRAADGTPVLGTLEEQAELIFQNIRRSLRHFGSDTQYIFKLTTYLRNWEDLPTVGQVRSRYLPRPVPATSVVISRLSEPHFLLEVDATALIPTP